MSSNLASANGISLAPPHSLFNCVIQSGAAMVAPAPDLFEMAVDSSFAKSTTRCYRYRLHSTPLLLSSTKKMMMSPSSPSSLQSKRRYASLDDEKMCFFFFFFQKKNKGAAAVERFAESRQVVTLTAPTASSSSSSSSLLLMKSISGDRYFLYPKLLFWGSLVARIFLSKLSSKLFTEEDF